MVVGEPFFYGVLYVMQADIYCSLLSAKNVMASHIN